MNSAFPYVDVYATAQAALSKAAREALGPPETLGTRIDERPNEHPASLVPMGAELRPMGWETALCVVTGLVPIIPVVERRV